MQAFMYMYKNVVCKWFQMAPKPALPKMRCLFAYDAQDTDELSFNEGETIELLREGTYKCSN